MSTIPTSSVARSGEPRGVRPRTLSHGLQVRGLTPSGSEGAPSDGRASFGRVAAIALASAMLIGGGIVHGTITHRWRTASRVDGPESRLPSVPRAIGDWDGTDSPISEAERRAAGVSGMLSRTYTNRRSGEALTVVLMCGPAGPVAVHPPTACYQGAGYRQSGATRQVALVLSAAGMPQHADRSVQSSPSEMGTVRHVFALADFYQPTHPEKPQPRIYWAWSADGTWSVPESPRLEFTGNPILFKLYVTCERPLSDKKSASSPIDEFLKELVPAIHRSVFPAK